MRYLIFDIECCDGTHICEFGYCIADEQFNILQQENIVINPEHPINLSGRKTKPDIRLFYTEDQYKSALTFPHYYPTIKSLLESPEQIIGGYAISNDANFIKVACQEYNLPPINFSFIDAQRIYNECFAEKKFPSLEEAGSKLELRVPEHLHKSDEDALFTLNLLKKMCEETNMNLPDLIKTCPTCTGKSVDFDVRYDKSHQDIESWVESAKNSADNRIRKYKEVLFRKYIINAKKKREKRENGIAGSKFCVSLNYEKNHFREMLALVKIISDKGGIYTQKSTDSNFFATYHPTDECVRLNHVTQAVSHGKKIQIITFEDLLNMLQTDEGQLSAFPFPPVEAFTGVPARQYKESSGGVSIADLLKFKHS